MLCSDKVNTTFHIRHYLFWQCRQEHSPEMSVGYPTAILGLVELPLTHVTLDAFHASAFREVQEGTHPGEGHLLGSSFVLHEEGTPELQAIEVITKSQLQALAVNQVGDVITEERP